MRLRLISVTFAIVGLVLAACGGSTTAPAATAAATTAATAAATAAATEAPGTKTFVISQGDSGVANIPTLVARDELNAKGWNVKVVQVKDVSLSVDGMTRGEFQFGRGAVNAYMLAIQKGAPLKIIQQAVNNEWTFYTKESITKCAEIDGKKLAISSEGGVSTAITRNWINQECPTAKPSYLVIANSSDRFAALLSGQIDASPLATEDGTLLEEKGGTKFRKLADFARDLPNLETTMFAVNGDWAKQNPGSVQAFLRAHLESQRRIATESNYLAQMIEKYKSELSTTPSPKTIDAYKAKWKINGINEKDMQYTLDFFTKSGAIQPGLTLAQCTDLSYLDAVLAAIGKK